ncbi:hypothetical protein F2Q68_00034201 [Brassica cretica]|uniref:Uncharacterized protein n=2 Tax=Brassica cretica TaxID=69181 RepID=A0ABQ7EIR4_BRACR|nr:hypothetical protein F2Q68_00034201 [Brassica cretica]KAF3596570.1 hypothetical protein DY000_02021734 [Brassica cretica]
MLAVLLFNAVDFSVVDNTGDLAGGRRFRKEIGDVNYTTKSLRAATAFTWRLFQQANKPSDRRFTPKISMVMENGDRVAYSSQEEIHFNAGYLLGVLGDVRREFTGVVYHKVVHSWQWNGAGQAPSGLVEEIADYVRMKEGYAASHWVGPGQGDRPWPEYYELDPVLQIKETHIIGTHLMRPSNQQLNQRSTQSPTQPAKAPNRT